MDIQPIATEVPAFQRERTIETWGDKRFAEISIEEVQSILTSWNGHSTLSIYLLINEGENTFYRHVLAQIGNLTTQDFDLNGVEISAPAEVPLLNSRGSAINQVYTALGDLEGVRLFLGYELFTQYHDVFNLTLGDAYALFLATPESTEESSSQVVRPVIPITPTPESTPTPTPEPAEPELVGAQREHRMIGDLRAILVSENEVMEVLNKNLGNTVTFYFEILNTPTTPIHFIMALIKLEDLGGGRYNLTVDSYNTDTNQPEISIKRETADPQNVLLQYFFNIASAILLDEQTFNENILDGQPLPEGTVERYVGDVGLVTITLARLKEFIEIAGDTPVTIYFRPVNQDRLAYNYSRITYTYISSEDEVIKEVERITDDGDVVNSRKEVLDYTSRSSFIDNLVFPPETLQYMSQDDFNRFMNTISSRNLQLKYKGTTIELLGIKNEEDLNQFRGKFLTVREVDPKTEMDKVPFQVRKADLLTQSESNGLTNLLEKVRSLLVRG